MSTMTGILGTKKQVWLWYSRH